MNIVYLNSHDTGRYVSPYGFDVRTPNIQKLAEEGVTFRHAHSVAPTCSPSRAGLCLGRYPHCSGILGLGHRGFRPEDFSQHIAMTLRNNGYETASWTMADNHIGAGGFPNGGELVGYERHLGHEKNDESNQQLVDFIKEDHECPFFLSASYVTTHRIGRGFMHEADTEKDDPRYSSVPPLLPDTPEVRADWSHFKTDVNALDRLYGEVIDAIDEAGLKNDTLVIATTDHGPAFPGMKCNPTVHGTGVFLVMRGPGGFSGGKVVESLMNQLDLYPTICDLAGIGHPKCLEGKSLLPTLEDPQFPLHENVYAEVTYHAAYEPYRVIRDSRYVYYKRFDERTLPVLVNIDASPSRDVWLEDGYGKRKVGEEGMYDTFYDSSEMNNLASHPAYEETKRDLAAKLKRWMEETDDPLLEGPVPVLEGQVANGQDEVDVG